MPKLLNQATVVLIAKVVLLGLLSQQEVQAATFRLEEATIDSINAAFDSGELTSKELTQLYLNRINAYDKQGPKINSIITINPEVLDSAAELDRERQLTGPRSPLHGIPILLKDNYDTFDLPTTAGSVLLKGSIPPDDGFLVKQFRDAGAVILGKANMSEWAWGTPPSLIGIPRNPYKLNRSASGSSSGTGAAIAANFAVVGTGSDTGGSIRGPAAVNGLVGIKPTLGLTSRDGIIPLALSFDTGGPMARTVTDAAITLGVMTGVDPNDPATFESEGKFYKDYTQFLDVDALKGARIGVAQDFFGSNPEVDQSVKVAIAKMEDLGATIVEPIRFPKDVLAARGTYPETEGVWPTINYTEFKAQIADYLATTADKYPKTLEEIIAISKSPEIANSESPVSEFTIETLLQPAQVTGGLKSPAYLDAVENGVPFITNAVQDILDRHNLDALVYPTIGCAADPLPGIDDPTYDCKGNPYEATNLANITGFPDINVPTGFTEDGLPISVSFFGRAYSEPTLLGLAYSYEQVTMHRRSPTTTPSLAGEVFEYEPVPEPSSVFGTLALSAFGVGRLLKRKLNKQKRMSNTLPF